MDNGNFSPTTYNKFTPMGILLNTFNEYSNIDNLECTDWYIPAAGQLTLIGLNIGRINDCLNWMHGTIINEGNIAAHSMYWSSTESSKTTAWIYSFFDKKLTSWAITKESSHSVRLIRNF